MDMHIVTSQLGLVLFSFWKNWLLFSVLFLLGGVVLHVHRQCYRQTGHLIIYLGLSLFIPLVWARLLLFAFEGQSMGPMCEWERCLMCGSIVKHLTAQIGRKVHKNGKDFD